MDATDTLIALCGSFDGPKYAQGATNIHHDFPIATCHQLFILRHEKVLKSTLAAMLTVQLIAELTLM